MSLRLRCMGALVTLAATVVVLAACGSGSSGPPDLTPEGFLPFPPTPTPRIRTPAPTPVRHERYDICPDLPLETCVLPGDVVNMYNVLSLDRVDTLFVFFDGVPGWVLGADVEQVLRLFDREITLVEPSNPPLRLALYIEPRSGGMGDRSVTQGLWTVDLDAGMMRVLVAEGRYAQWPIPEGLVELVTSSFSPAATPEPRPTRPQLPSPPSPPPTNTPRPTSTAIPRSPVFFEHPDGELVWDGPDDSVRTFGTSHCRAPEEIREEYGIPDLLLVGEARGFHFLSVVSREDGWRWTGYYHGNWQIWQADDPLSFYLVYDGEEDIAFLYGVRRCV